MGLGVPISLVTPGDREPEPAQKRPGPRPQARPIRRERRHHYIPPRGYNNSIIAKQHIIMF